MTAIWLLCLFSFLVHVTTTKPPNIVLIVADDLGWNDVSFHGSSQIPTPNIDKLANTGVILNNYYVSPICTPTRSAIMTGKYPIHTGMQHSVIMSSQPYGLSLNETILPQYLKKLGYATHGVGKWHLGFFKYAYTPTRRGFDTFFGYWCGKGDYWDHSNDEEDLWGLDLHATDQENVRTEWGHYSTDLFTEKAQAVISSHNTSTPLFLYLPYQAVHTANYIQPLQAPPDLIKKFSNITDKNRRIFAAMVSSLDSAVGKVVDSLKAKGLYNNSIIVFTTDNGGKAGGWSSNYPLRGFKWTLWEGGVRGTAFVHSPLIAHPGRVSTDMMHVSDWLPTLYTVGGGNVHDIQNIDGYDIWNTISTGEMSPREEMLHNIDPVNWAGAMRYRDWKLIVNQTNSPNGWYPPPGTKQRTPLTNTLKNAVVTCGKPPSTPAQCDVKSGPCLFNIAKDPCEYTNVAKDEPQILESMLAWLEQYKRGMVPIRNVPADPSANPKNYGGVWTAWKDQ